MGKNHTKKDLFRNILKNKKMLKVVGITSILVFLLLLFLLTLIRGNTLIEKDENSYKAENNETIISYEIKKVKDDKADIIIIVENRGGIDRIDIEDLKLYCNNKTKVALDKTITSETEYYDIDVKLKEKDELERHRLEIDLAEGDGSLENPYIIRTSSQLQAINLSLNSNYRLGADINLNDKEWTEIGNSSTPFTGSLEGDNYTISNLKIESEDSNKGLFGYSSATIRNVNIEDFDITGNGNTGALVGTNTGYIENCNANRISVTGTGENTRWSSRILNRYNNR